MKNEKNIVVIKIGGHVVDNPETLEKFLTRLSQLDQPAILIHGGGKMATRVSQQLGHATVMHEGRRITDQETLRVTTMVYAGWINKSIAARLTALGRPAIGISGADAHLIATTMRSKTPIDFGYVGDLTGNGVNTSLLTGLLSANYTPVIAPITSDPAGQLLNTNADTIAAAVAESMCKTHATNLIYGFEKRGVIVNNEVLRAVRKVEASEMIRNGTVTEGMIVKLNEAMGAVAKGVQNVTIGHAEQLIEILNGESGTRIIE